MTLDYGVRARYRGPPIATVAWIALCAGLVVVSAAQVYAWLHRQDAAIAEAKRWTITGPPCPSLSPAGFLASPIKPAHGFDFDDVRFARAFGHASCHEIGYDDGRNAETYPVCQFTSPAVLQITTSRGQFYFAPEVRPATIAVRHGVPTCVMNSKFTAQGDFT